MCCVFYVDYPNMHVAGMDPVDRRGGEVEAMHASVRKERRQKAEAEGVVQVSRLRGGKPCRVVSDNEHNPQAEPEYDQMDVDDVEAMEGVGNVEEDVDDGQQRQR